MSPRPGGEADKIGNRYEAAWAIRHALYCLLDDERLITLEDIDIELQKGSEFTYVSADGTQVHQLKRQDGNKNFWSINALNGLGIFGAAAQHVAGGRHYHFASLIPCGVLPELADRARRSTDLKQFTQAWLSKALRTAFDQLAAPEVLGSAERAWSTLRGMWFEVQSELDVVQVNSMLAELSLDGASGYLASLAIGDILHGHIGQKLARAELLSQLSRHGIKPLAAGSRTTAREQAQRATDSWRGTVQRELLQPSIPRAEVGELLEELRDNRLALVVGTAGGGKSAVLEQAVAKLEASGAAVLAVRLDRHDTFASTSELGRQLGLAHSPAATIGLAADGRDAYLIVDQLDAVSLASGRMPESFDIVVDLVGEALSLPNVRVVLACREFDIDNDHRIRALADRTDMRKVVVGPLSTSAIDDAVASMGLEPNRLSALQRNLLKIPLNLVLLQSIASQPNALAFTSRGSLFEAFWERKRQTVTAKRPGGVRFNDVVARIANSASDRQTLSVPIETLDEGDLIEHANVLVSEHVLAIDGNRIAFFHETFFDYAFARLWVTRSESIVDFLLRDEQELFRRAQVRQILQHLYEREPDRFRDEVEALLLDLKIRFHIKETALAVLANLSEPSTDDAELILRVSATGPDFEQHLWQQLRGSQWFLRFDDDGTIAAWLDSADSDLRRRAINLMVSGGREHADRVAAHLAARQTDPDYDDWLRWVARFDELHANRTLFDLFLAGVRQGIFDGPARELWLSVHDVAKHQPVWAIELLKAWLVDHHQHLALTPQGKVAALDVREYGAAELVREAAKAEPLQFAETIVPYLQDVMSATELTRRVGEPVRDNHFSFRFAGEDLDDQDFDDALLAGTVRSLETVAQSSPDTIKPLLEALAADSHETAQFILYRTLTAAGEYYAEWSSELLLEGGSRLDCGYVADGDWVARELLRSISPHVSDEVHLQLEDQFRDLRDPYEGRESAGRAAFTFLSALEERRLSPSGLRRLGEYRRKFAADAPSAPSGIISGVVGSPISEKAAAKMSDDQWLSAMVKYGTDRTDWRSLTGGARELSHVLQKYTAEQPTRFAELALRMKADLNTAYGDALLRGLGDAEVPTGGEEAVYNAVRHIASFKSADNDRWLGWALRRLHRAAPIDLVGLVLDRALHSSDPADDTPAIVRDGEDGRSAKDLRTNGINTARGSLAESLGDLLVNDADGTRTALVRPQLQALASDPVLGVRSCVAHPIAASLRHARPEALDAFNVLVDADDTLLGSDLVQQLMIYIGNVNPDLIDPVVQRMLASSDDDVREAGGQLAAFAALEWGRPELIDQALALDVRVREGLAHVCARRIDRTSNARLATMTLQTLMDDSDEEVLKAVAEVAPHLRDLSLRPYSALLGALIQSAAYAHSTPQLLLTLQHAPDKVDDLVLLASKRFLEVFGEKAGDIRTGAAGDAHYISELVVRGLAQSRDKRHRAALLDVLDALIKLGVYGIEDAIAKAERG